MGTTAAKFIERLAAKHRVLVIGGLAVVAHGFNRPTKDADIWLEPLDSPTAWADALIRACAGAPALTLHTLPDWRQVHGTDIATAADEVGLNRLKSRNTRSCAFGNSPPMATHFPAPYWNKATFHIPEERQKG